MCYHNYSPANSTNNLSFIETYPNVYTITDLYVRKRNETNIIYFKIICEKEPSQFLYNICWIYPHCAKVSTILTTKLVMFFCQISWFLCEMSRLWCWNTLTHLSTLWYQRCQKWSNVLKTWNSANANVQEMWCCVISKSRKSNLISKRLTSLTPKYSTSSHMQ